MVAKGTKPTDTKQEVSAVSYKYREDNQTIQETWKEITVEIVANYNRGFVGNYSRAFAGDYVAAFTGDYTRTQGDCSKLYRDYTRDFVGNYSRAFTRDSRKNRKYQIIQGPN